VVIHDNIEIPRPTTAFIGKYRNEQGPGPIYFQNHGNPVRFRNVWVVKK